MYNIKILHTKVINRQLIKAKELSGICAINSETKVMQSFKNKREAEEYCKKYEKGVRKIPEYPKLQDIERGMLAIVGQVGKWRLYNVEYYDVYVILPTGEKIKMPTYANAIRYCKQHTEFLTNEGKKKRVIEYNEEKGGKNTTESESNIYKKKFKIKTQGKHGLIFATAEDKEKAVKLVKENKLTLDDLHFYVYAASVNVFNFLMQRVKKYLIQNELEKESEKAGFWDKYIFDRDVVANWIIEEKRYKGYILIIFGLLKEQGIITSCGAGYLFDEFHEPIEMSLEEKGRLADINELFSESEMEWIVL